MNRDYFLNTFKTENCIFNINLEDYKEFFDTKIFQNLIMTMNLNNEEPINTEEILNSRLDSIIKRHLINNYKNEFSIFNLTNLNIEKFSPEKQFENNFLRFNINELYDHIINEHNLLGQNIKLYRIESKDNLGIYDAGGLYLFDEDEKDFRLDPFNDKKLNNIFNSMNDYDIDKKYKSKWKFAFQNKEDLNKWIGGKKTYQNILNDNRSFHIKELLVPENMVIKGDNQVIYKSEHVRMSFKIELKNLNNKSVVKNTYNI